MRRASLPYVPRLARIDRRPAQAPFVRAIRAAAADRSISREDIRFFALAYAAGLITFLSWLA